MKTNKTEQVLEKCNSLPKLPADMWQAGMPSIQSVNKWGKPALKVAPHVSVSVEQSLERVNGEVVVAEIVRVKFRGIDTYPIKDSLKAAGFSFSGGEWSAVVDAESVADTAEKALRISGAPGIVVSTCDNAKFSAVRKFNRPE